MKNKGIFSSIEELYEYYGREKADELLYTCGYDIGTMLIDGDFCELYRNEDNKYTEEDEAEFIALVGEEIANKIKREQPKNYPIMVCHWCFMKSDVIRINEKNEEDEETYRQNTPYKDIK